MKKQLAQVQDEFKEYQLAMYLYGFGYFLEVLLQENFDAAYSCVRPFIDNIDMVNRMYNQPMTLIFNEENLYLAASETV